MGVHLFPDSNSKPFLTPFLALQDIMENVGYDPNNVVATIHCGKFNHVMGTQIGKSTPVSDPHNQFHVYSIDWTPTHIKGYLDGVNYFSYAKSDGSFEAWPFDTNFNIIVNNAIGGAWGGAMGVDDAAFPKQYTIDYVRVYQSGTHGAVF